MHSCRHALQHYHGTVLPATWKEKCISRFEVSSRIGCSSMRSEEGSRLNWSRLVLVPGAALNAAPQRWTGQLPIKLRMQVCVQRQLSYQRPEVTEAVKQHCSADVF
jgi:hypothetical protein